MEAWESQETLVHAGWSFVLFSFATFSCIFSPIRIARVDSRPCAAYSNEAIDIFETVGDFLFALEIIRVLVGVLTAINKGPHRLRRRCKPTWLTMEILAGVISTVPLFADMYGVLAWKKKTCHRVNVLTWLRILRTLRLFSVHRYFKSLKRFMEDQGVEVTPSASRMIVIFYFFLIGISVSGCAYLIVACPPGHRGGCRRGWEGKEDAAVTWAVVDEQMNSNWRVQYLRAIYFSMQTLFTIGYGDNVGPVSRAEIILSCVLMFFGQFLYSALIASMSSLVANRNVLTMRFDQEMDTLNSYMDAHSIPQGLQTRVKDYFAYINKKQFGVLDSKLLLSSLPHRLSLEINELRTNMLVRVPFFSREFRPDDDEFLHAAAAAMESRAYTPNSTIMFAGERQRELVVVTSGSAELHAATDETAICSLLPGDFIGDQELILGSTNVFEVVTACNFVDTLVLMYPKLVELLETFRDTVNVHERDPATCATVREHSARTQKYFKLRSSVGRAGRTNKLNRMMQEMTSNPSMMRNRNVVKPSSPFHQFWDVLTLLALLYLCIATPLRIFVQCVARTDRNSRCRIFKDCSAWKIDLVADYLIDMFFLADMVLNYRFFAFSDIASDGRPVVQANAEDIRSRYLGSWRFAIDVCASAPVDVLGSFLGCHSLLRIPHLLRLFLLDTYTVQFQHHLAEAKRSVSLSTGTVSIIKTAFACVVIFHLVSVIWGILHFRQGDSYRSARVQYLHSLYFVVTTFTTVGYGDIVPEDPVETAAAFFIGVFGALFAAAVLANVTAASRKIRSLECDLGHQRTCVEAFVGLRGLSGTPIHKKIVAYFEFKESHSHGGVDEERYLKDALPPHLYDDFVLYKVHTLVADVPEFQSFSSTCLRALMRALTRKFFMEDEWIVTEDRAIEGMYFVTHGHAQVLDFETRNVRADLHARGTFGNECLLLNPPPSVQLGDVRWRFLAKSVTITMTWFLSEFDFRITVTDLYPGGQ